MGQPLSQSRSAEPGLRLWSRAIDHGTRARRRPAHRNEWAHGFRRSSLTHRFSTAPPPRSRQMSLPMSNHDLCHFCNSITKRKRLKGLVALYTNDLV